jgi:hypothetical protein
MAELRALQRQNLKELVVEASRALATLDAARLEELALSCQALNRDLSRAGTEERAQLAYQAREAQGDMAVFARVLEVTKANLKVMNRLRSLRTNHLEYGEQLKQGWQPAESAHGDH